MLKINPGSEKARKLTAISGQKCFELSTHTGRFELMERALLESTVWQSSRVFLTWRTKTTEAHRLIFSIVPSSDVEIPTPTANDSKNATLPISQKERTSLIGYLLRSGVKGVLNPNWVEWLMGYPIGWTACGVPSFKKKVDDAKT